MTLGQTAHDFFEACETGTGREACKGYCNDGASFACQADALDALAVEPCAVFFENPWPAVGPGGCTAAGLTAAFRHKADGHGLGRMPVAMQGGAMGWRGLAIAIREAKKERVRIFETLEFRYVDRDPECSDPIEPDPCFFHLQRDPA